jgi:pyruvate kinase
MRKTKIVCTIGPASESPQIVKELIKGGMDVARLNFSHGTRKWHRQKIREIRRISRELKKPVAILQDLGGPKIRIGLIKGGATELRPGGTFILTNRQILGNEREVSVTYRLLPQVVKPGDSILLADGMLELRVLDTDKTDIRCHVVVGGPLSSQKGINLPTKSIRLPSLTDKDKTDLLFGIKQGVDLVALSFVRRAHDVKIAKDIIERNRANIPVIAKIEKHEALECIDDILDAADGIMVARGDLGVETPLERVPAVQKILIKKSNAAAKPVITATQMLKSMVENVRPTRAETTDVVNAIYDGTDGVMLSEETASGRFPVKSVQMMVRIAKVADKSFPFEKFPGAPSIRENHPRAISQAACYLAQGINAAAIITPTESGATARFISAFRPPQPIVALSPRPYTVKRLAVCWGVFPFLVKEFKDTDDAFKKSIDVAKRSGIVSKGDTVVITAGIPAGVPGNTNLIKIEIVTY